MFYDISDPTKIQNLAKRCSGEDGKVIRCYGFGKKYCPSTCYYAVMKDIATKIQEVIRRKE